MRVITPLIIVGVIILLAILAAAIIRQIDPVPRIKNHPEPHHTTGIELFINAGCPFKELGVWLCTAGSPLFKLGCHQIRELQLAGGFQPYMPIATCLVVPYYINSQSPGIAYSEMKEEGKYFFTVGGASLRFVRYVAWRNNQFEIIKTIEDLRMIFAPIENASEALSYALATNDLFALYGIKYEPQYTYFVKSLEDTYVEATTDGYLVHLFHYQLYSCGPHITSAVTVRVSRDGLSEKISTTPLFKDPAQDLLCID